MFSWPTGPWTVWVTIDGRLCVTGPGKRQPERTAFPVAGGDSRRAAGAICRLLGHRCIDSPGWCVDSFGGRIGDVVELQRRLAEHRPKRRCR